MRRAVRMVLMLGAGAAGAALAVLVGVAIAKSFTLAVTKNATVTNFLSQGAHTTKSDSIVTARGGFAVYTLTGDSKSHPKCTARNGCYAFWAPAKIGGGKNPTKANGIKGKLTTWKHNGFTQLLLAGHPLYFFSGDHSKAHATGEAIKSFGGVWHVIVTKVGSSTPGSPGTTPTMPTYPTTPAPTTTTPTTPYPYP